MSEKVEDKAIASKARGARVVIIPEKGENPAGEAPGLWQEIFGFPAALP